MEGQMGEICSMEGVKITAYKLMLGRLEGKRPLVRSRRRWFGNIKMEFDDGILWTGLVWLRIGSSRELL
jgi:hypothetical protein